MKLVKEHINEKFVEDSDPIHAMEIGLITQLKKEYIKQYSWYKKEDITLSDLLHFCIGHKKYGLDVIEALIDAGADVNDKDSNCLADAVSYRDIEAVKFLLNKGAKATHNRSRALSRAIGQKHFDIAELLIKNGASIKVVGLEELIYAINNNDITLIKWMLDKGVNPNVYNYRALRYALKNKNYELADLFVKEYIKDRGLK